MALEGENLLTTPVGQLGIIGMRGCEEITAQVDKYLSEWRDDAEQGSFQIESCCPRFSSGEGKGLIKKSVRGHDIFIISDAFNYGVTYKMYGMNVPMSPDDHFQDLKRIIAATGGKARRITVIMPMLYEGRQHRRVSRESLDCATALQELARMGVTNIVTFDPHDPRVQNAVPLIGFDCVQPKYQMVKALVHTVEDIKIDRDNITIISPDEGGMSRCIYYSSVLGLDLGMFYKRRDYSRIVGGRNPIISHEYLGGGIEGKDVIIVDDIIASGDSVIDIAEQLKAKKVRRVFVFATFGLFTEGLERFDEAYKNKLIEKVFTTNLVYRKEELKKKEWYKEVDMSKYIAYIINTLNYDRSMSDLLDPVKRINKLLGKINK
ncbi:MAG TPA: ribose-phosphate pyrophosphokinase [Ruminiclostridium sp.]|nr:ribose-phosphate pyrophosphokinase [Ruminiclostridium sp.]